MVRDLILKASPRQSERDSVCQGPRTQVESLKYGKSCRWILEKVPMLFDPSSQPRTVSFWNLRTTCELMNPLDTEAWLIMLLARYLRTVASLNCGSGILAVHLVRCKWLYP